MRKNPQGPKAILHGILSSDQGYVSSMPGKSFYEYRCYKGLQDDVHPLKVKSGLLDTKQWWALGCQPFDQIVFHRLCDVAEADSEFAQRVKAVFESMKGQAM